MAALKPPAWFARFRRTLPGALIWRGLCYAPRFTGRARRTELALTVIVCVAASFLLGLVAVKDRTSFLMLNMMGLGALTGTPIVAAIVRRLHDTNRHGWAIAIALFPYVGWAYLGFYLILDGKEGANIFGPDPRA